MQWVVEVPGLPRPKGSWKCVGRGGRHQLVEQVPSTEWRAAVTNAGRLLARQAGRTLEGPIQVGCIFTFPLPKSIKPEHRWWPFYARGVGDIDKLARCVLDCFTVAQVWLDDGQVCDLRAIKVYPHTPGVRDVRRTPGVFIRIQPLEPEMDTLL